MIPLLTLEYPLGHPYPRAHWFLLATVIVFLATTPALVVLNFTTLGFELVPSLQTEWRNENATLITWWGARHLPRMLRPRAPRCEPKDLGRGDRLRLTGLLFEYTVLSILNQSDPVSATSGQKGKRVGYKGESFAGCYVDTTLYYYSMADTSHSVIVGVYCRGYKEYPVEITMQTTVTFSPDLPRLTDFVGQYYGRYLANITGSSDYRDTVLAVLNVIATDAISIVRKPNLVVPPLTMRVLFDTLDPDTALLPDRSTTSSMTYANGSQPLSFPLEAFIYTNTIYNLVYVVMDAVNLDLGNTGSPNLFRNTSRFPEVVLSNRAMSTINNETNWAKGGTQSFYYGRIPDQYQTWAETLLKGPPANITLTDLTGPNKSVITTTYLCPTYELKPTSALLASVFVGSATMTLSVWGAWMFFTALLAKRIMPPEVICDCDDCKARRVREPIRMQDMRRNAASRENNGIIPRLMARMGVNGRPKNVIHLMDLDPKDHGYDDIPQSGDPMLSPTSLRGTRESLERSGAVDL